jgi:type IV secretory pathway TrbL component
VPEWYVMVGVQVAPGDVVALRVALAPGATDVGSAVMVTKREAAGGAVTAGVVGAEVTRAVGAAVAAAFVGEAPSGMP